MPPWTVELLHRFLTQSEGRLSQRARDAEFEMLTREDAEAVENLWMECHPEAAQ